MLGHSHRIAPVAVLVVLVVALALSVPDTRATAGEQYVISHGVDTIVVPRELQREALQVRLAETIALRTEAIRERLIDSASLAELEQTIADWSSRLAADDFGDLSIEVPYVHLGSRSIYWSQYSYDGASWTANQKDPTNVVVWDEATAWDFNNVMRNHTRSTHRWEDDDGGVCVHATQYVAMKNHATYAWTWVASDGLQHVPDACASGQREHLRFWSLNSWDHDFGYWKVVSAHQENFRAFPPGHDVTSWENGENLVQNSFRTSDNGSLLYWVDEIINHDFGNAGGSPYNNELGRLIRIGNP